jgi:hypothetical protein
VAVLQEDVLGLDVPVYHALPVRVPQCGRHLAGDSHGVFDRELTLALELCPQGFSLHERHHVVEPPLDGPGVDEAEDVGVMQIRGDLDLLEEPLTAYDRGQLGPEDLDRNATIVTQVLGLVDRGHPSLAHGIPDAVAVREPLDE